MGRQCREQHLQHSTAYGVNRLFLGAAKLPEEIASRGKRSLKSVRRQHNKGEFSSCKIRTLRFKPKQGAEISSDSVLRYEHGRNIKYFCFSAALLASQPSQTRPVCGSVAVALSSPRTKISHNSSCEVCFEKKICRISRRSLALPARLRWDSLSRSIASASPSTSLGRHG